MNEIERVKEKIAQLLALDQGWHWENATKFPHITKHYLGLAGKVLATEGVLVKSDDQSLPPIHQDPSKYSDGAVEASIETQRIMLKAGFVRVVKEERNNNRRSD